MSESCGRMCGYAATMSDDWKFTPSSRRKVVVDAVTNH